MGWAIAPDVRHLSGHRVNASLTCSTGTVGNAVKHCIAFSAPHLTSSLCPQNNSTAVGFQCRRALKPRGTALQRQTRGER